MKAVRLAILGVLASALLIPMSAQATHCADRLIIFSSNNATGGRSINSNAVTCSVFEHDYDGRLINPGSDQVSVRLTLPTGGTCQTADEENGIEAETRQGHIEGLGADEELTLTCFFDATLAFHAFRSGLISIDPLAQGCITATVPSEFEETSFHTIGELDCF